MRQKTDQQIHKELLSAGIAFFQIRAGYIAQHAPIEEFGKVEFSWKIQTWYIYPCGASENYASRYEYDGVLGQIHAFTITAQICLDCASALQNYYGHSCDIISNTREGDECNSCGMVCDDYIPF